MGAATTLRPVDLSGTWRARLADEAARRTFADMQVDASDGDWVDIDVPGHWQSTKEFTGSDGPLLCRRSFASPADEGTRWWLVLDGLFYQGDVWLDGGYVGATEGYFFPHQFEVTDAVGSRREHVLAVEVTCNRPADLTAKRNLTGVFQHWDCLDPEWNPGGIWQPVRLEPSGPVRIARLRTLVHEATDVRAVVRFRAEVDATEAGAVAFRTTIGGTEHVTDQPLAAGENRVEWSVTVDRPDLWWPRSLGGQAMADVAVEVVLPDTGVSDRRAFRTGLRQVRMDDWVLHVNGERLFVKGANQGPQRMALADVSVADCERDVGLAIDAGLDLLRVHAHVGPPALYDAADRGGLLLWQDLPLQWGYAAGVRKQAARQAREAVDLLGHHPSIALWCGHNEPIALDVTPGQPVEKRRRTVMRLVAGWELPTWNKSVLDRSIKSALAKSDPTRPVVAHSGIPPGPFAGGTDSHLYFGWYHGNERDLPGFLAAWPRMARFVSEFGAQAVPANAAFMEPERWPELDWDRLARRHALQRWVFDTHVPPAEHATFDEWRDATQAYQATVLKHHIETLRRLKYRPTGGFCAFSFGEAYPAVAWSVLDDERAPKAGYHAVAEACRPVIVVADRPAAAYRPGQPIALDVHVVSDLRTPIRGAEVTAALGWPGDEQRWRWGGDIPADGCERVGTLQAVVPDAPGELTLSLDLSAGEMTAINRYVSRIARS
ncbi:MAG: putative glycosidase [Acidimicrobiales bacterium]|nr:putative glycosidase [Acidimicrobiales bacterium]